MTQPATGPATRAPLVIPANPGAPIACDMTTASDTASERFAEYRRLFEHALVGRARTAGEVSFEFAARPGVAEWVADLAQREAACCPFFGYHVAFGTRTIIWRTSGAATPAVQSFLDEFYGLPERFGEGLEGLLERLAGRGVIIHTSAPGRYSLDERPSTHGVLAKLRAVCGC